MSQELERRGEGDCTVCQLQLSEGRQVLDPQVGKVRLKPGPYTKRKGFSTLLI